MRVSYAPDTPPEVRAALEPLIDRWRPLLPGWLEYLEVLWRTPENDAASLSVTVREEYRHAYLYVHPGWLDQGQERREQNLVHELQHTPLRRLGATWEALLEAAGIEADSPLGRWAREVWRQAQEAAVEDLANGVMRMRGAGAPTKIQAERAAGVSLHTGSDGGILRRVDGLVRRGAGPKPVPDLK